MLKTAGMIDKRPGKVKFFRKMRRQGFDPKATDPATGSSGGLGLTGIAERVRVLGGHWEIQSAPGKGTRLTVTIPLAPDPKQR